MTLTKEKLVLSIDGLNLHDTLALAAKVGRQVQCLKVHDICDRHGVRDVVKQLGAHGTRVWVDYKIHDIPETVRLRAYALARAGASIITVHAPGGIDMMKAAVTGAHQGTAERDHDPSVHEGATKVYAVTVLTSLDEAEVNGTFGGPSIAKVLQFARNAKMAGVYGIVCSALEVGLLNKRPELKGLELIVPGTRLVGQAVDDQKRTDGVPNAVRNGATSLVAGRAFTAPKADPVAALEQFEREIELGLAPIVAT